MLHRGIRIMPQSRGTPLARVMPGNQAIGARPGVTAAGDGRPAALPRMTAGVAFADIFIRHSRLRPLSAEKSFDF
jgi:hypothetical protein